NIRVHDLDVVIWSNVAVGVWRSTVAAWCIGFPDAFKIHAWGRAGASAERILFCGTRDATGPGGQRVMDLPVGNNALDSRTYGSRRDVAQRRRDIMSDHRNDARLMLNDRCV